MAGGDEIVVDSLRRTGSVARPEMAFQAGLGPLIQVLGVDETWRVAAKARLVVRMQPLVGWAVARFALNAESVMGDVC